MRGSRVNLIYKMLGWGAIIIAIMLILFRWLGPFLLPPTSVFENFLQSQLQSPMTIKAISLRFVGYQPVVKLNQVTIYAQENPQRKVASIDEVLLSLSIPKLLCNHLQINKLTILGATFAVEYHGKQTFNIEGIPDLHYSFPALDSGSDFLPKNSDDFYYAEQKIKEFFNQFLKQSMKKMRLKALDIQESQVLLKTRDHHLSLTNLSIFMSTGTLFRLNINANLNTNLNVNIPTTSHFDFKVEIPVWNFATHLLEKKIYLACDNIDLVQLAKLTPTLSKLGLLKGNADVKTWIHINEDDELNSLSDIQLHQIELATNENHNENRNESNLAFDTSGALFIQFSKQGLKVQGQNWELPENKIPFDFILSNVPHHTQKWTFETHHFPLQNVSASLAKIGSLPKEWKKTVKQYRAEGMLDYVFFEITKDKNDWTVQLAQVLFNKVGLSSLHKPRSLQGLSGTVTYDRRNHEHPKGRFALNTKNAQWIHGELFSQPLFFTGLTALIDYQQTEKDWLVKMYPFETQLNGETIGGSMRLAFSTDLTDKSLPKVDISLSAPQLKIGNLLSFLPTHLLNQELVEWLDTALIKQDTVNASMVLRGDLADFPFDHHEGIFQAHLNFNNTKLNYDKDWPGITNLNADLLFHNRSVFVKTHAGTIAGIKWDALEGKIDDLDATPLVLNLHSEFKNTLENTLQALANSPLKTTLVDPLTPLQLKGNIDISLGLLLPLDAKIEEGMKIQGQIRFHETQMILAQAGKVESLNGTLGFTKDSLRSENLVGRLFNQPTTFKIDTLLTPFPRLLVEANGKVKVEDLENLLNIDIGSNSPSPFVSGKIDYNAILTLKTESYQPMEFTFNSNLVGLQINAPYPFAKTVDETKPLELKFHFDHIVQNEQIMMTYNYAQLLNGANKWTKKRDTWDFLGGEVIFDDKKIATIRDDNVLLINGQLKDFNLSEWKTFYANFPFLKQLSLSSSDNKPAVELQTQLSMENLILYQHIFPNTKVAIKWDKPNTQWDVHFDGAAIKGNMQIPQPESKRDIVVTLQTVTLNNNELSSPSLEKIALTNPLSIQIKKLFIKKKAISQIQARIEPTAKGLFFPTLKANLTGTQINLSGQWDYVGTEETVSLKGKVHTNNITQTLKALGFDSTLKKAKGEMNFSVAWLGGPTIIDYPSLNGHAKFSLELGFIHGVNPGIGRVLSLVNLDNVQRRLNFDFSDLTEKGFAFNELSGKCQFGKGKISSNNVLIKGPSAKIEAVGQADLVTQGIIGEIIVMPNVTASLPVAAAIAAGNPAIGAAVWMVDKMVGNKIQSINKLRYNIAGTWQAPLVSPVPFHAS